MKALSTARLTLEPFVAADADDLFSIRGDRLAMAHWDWPGDDDIGQTRTVARMFVDDMERGASMYWTARTHSNREFVGVVDLSELTSQSADLGFMVRSDRWGHGYGGELATAAMAEAWVRRLERLTARIHAGNDRSSSLLRRLGFVEVATRAVDIRPGVQQECRFYEIRRSVPAQ